jgi:hypothetical protein
MVDVLEITKLADQDGPNTIATRSLGDQNLLLVERASRYERQGSRRMVYPAFRAVWK